MFSYLCITKSTVKILKHSSIDWMMCIFFYFYFKENTMVNLSIGWIQLERNYHCGKAWSIDRISGSKEALYCAHRWTVLDIPIKSNNNYYCIWNLRSRNFQFFFLWETNSIFYSVWERNRNHIKTFWIEYTKKNIEIRLLWIALVQNMFSSVSVSSLKIKLVHKTKIN